eukprot:gene5222-10452_t
MGNSLSIFDDDRVAINSCKAVEVRNKKMAVPTSIVFVLDSRLQRRSSIEIKESLPNFSSDFSNLSNHRVTGNFSLESIRTIHPNFISQNSDTTKKKLAPTNNVSLDSKVYRTIHPTSVSGNKSLIQKISVRASSEKLRCKMILFKSKKVHVEPNIVMTREPTPANKEHYKDYSLMDDITPNPGITVYYENKMFWRTKNVIDIHVVMHYSLCGKKIFEVIPYDTVTEIEWKRVYLDIPTLISSIGQERYNTAVQEALKIRRKSSLCFLAYDGGNDGFVMDEPVANMHVLGKLVVCRLLCIIQQYITNSIKGDKEVIYSLGKGDNARFNPVLNFSELPPNTLTPAIIRRQMKHKQDEEAAAMNNISMLCRQASDHRFKAEALFGAII